MVTSFNTYKLITESVDENKHIKHLSHIEEHAFDGSHALNHSISTLEHVHNKLQNNVKNDNSIGTKSDGSVSIVFGHHPITKKFFVATKSAFNKDPKINYSHEDINHNHGHIEGLADKLHTAFDNLSKISGKSGVYQSDLMYTEKDKHKDKNNNIHFTPNTITYHVNTDSKYYPEVNKSKLGIAVHTKYEGIPYNANTLEGMSAKTIDGRAELNHHKDIHLRDTNFEMNSNYDDYKNKVNHHISVAKNIANTLKSNDHLAIQHHSPMLKSYINDTIKNDVKPNIYDYKKFSENKLQKEVDKLKSDKGKEKKTDIKNQFLNHIDNNHESLNKALQIHDHIQNAKDIMIDAMNKSKQPYDHSINGKKSDPEGYVITHKNIITKMVNRKEFSKHNFNNERFRPKIEKD